LQSGSSGKRPEAFSFGGEVIGGRHHSLPANWQEGFVFLS
jgi:hypothetical protein